MRRSNLATLLYLAVVFASGVVVGGFALRLYMANTVGAVAQTHPSRSDLRRMYIQEMQSRLHLSDAQVAQLRQISEATGQRMHDMRKTVEDEHVSSVNAMLDAGQKAEYAKMREERDKRRQQQVRK